MYSRLESTIVAKLKPTLSKAIRSPRSGNWKWNDGADGVPIVAGARDEKRRPRGPELLILEAGGP